MSWDIIRLDHLIFNDSSQDSIRFNQRHKSYDKETILYVIKYQKDNNLNNSATAQYFNISRNTLAKWKKIYKIQ